MKNFEVLKPFGPSIVKIKMPDKMIQEINEYVDKVIQDEQKIKELNEGGKLIGKVQQEFLMEVNFMKQIKWAEFLASNVSSWAKEELNKLSDSEKSSEKLKAINEVSKAQARIQASKN